MIKKIFFCLREPFLKTHIANICKHKTKQEGFINNGDFCTTTIMEMPLTVNGHPDYCLECIGNMSIRCAWCNEPIVIGKPITLYIPNEIFEIPKHAISYTEGDITALVGCLRWECSVSLADRAGFWLPGNDGAGRVERVPTVYEQLLAAEGNSALIVENSSDIDEARNPHLFPINQ